MFGLVFLALGIIFFRLSYFYLSFWILELDRVCLGFMGDVATTTCHIQAI